jgi:hypothetical protein
VGLGRRLDTGDLGLAQVEVALEPGGCADQQVARGGVAVVGDGVHGVAGREGDAARARGDDVPAELQGQGAVEDVPGLVESVVVQRRAGPPCGHGVLHQADVPRGLLAAQPDVEGGRSIHHGNVRHLRV